MGLDATGQWHPLCDLEGCLFDQDDDGMVEIDAFVEGQFRKVRVHCCASHAMRIRAGAEQLVA